MALPSLERPTPTKSAKKITSFSSPSATSTITPSGSRVTRIRELSNNKVTTIIEDNIQEQDTEI